MQQRRGGDDLNGKTTNEVLELEIPSFKMKEFPSMVKPHYDLISINIQSDVLVMSKRVELYKSLIKPVVSVEIYSKKAKTWTHRYVEMKEQFYYCITSFMSKLYLIGGWNVNESIFTSCCTYDISNNTLNKITDLNVPRFHAACTVFT